MKTAKTVTEAACDEVQLEVLLFGDEDSAEFRKSADHVESCAQLSGSPHDAGGRRRWLG